MENKLSLADVADLLSQRTGCTKKMAEQFLKELFAQASAVISSGESLKISGLGTFKSVWVESRNSVNVRSGESFEIPGHYKLSFVPDKKMKDAVNAPFADFETVVLSDHIDFAAMTDTTDNDDKTQSEDTATEIQETIPSEFLREKKLEDPTDKETSETIISGKSDKEGFSQQQEEVVSDISDKKNECRGDDSEIDTFPLKKTYGWTDVAKAIKDIVVVLLMLATVTGVGYVVYKIYQDRKELKQRKMAVSEQREKKPSAILPLEKDTIEQTLGEDTHPDKKAPIAVEKITEGLTLAKLSLKHYGDKAFWVYIYLENKEKISNPDNIPIGISVSIPAKENYRIDAGNQQWIDEAKTLADEILGNVAK